MARATQGRPKGLPKTGGRKRGTPNKRTEDLVERLQGAMGPDWCPLVALAQIAEDEGTSLEMRVRCLSEIAPYLQPKRRAVEHGPATPLEDLVVGSLADHIQAARELVARDIGADLLRPRYTIATGVPDADDPEPKAADPTPPKAAPEPANPTAEARPAPRLTDAYATPEAPQDFDPYANADHAFEPYQ